MSDEAKEMTVNSIQSLVAFQAVADQLFSEFKYVRFSWRIGVNRRLPQNGLFHLWLRDYAAHLLEVPPKTINEEIMEGMKQEVKKRYYAETGEVWMVHKAVNPFSREIKLRFRSSAKYTPGELFQLMSWLQMQAARDGLVLESKGDYLANQKKQNQ